MPPRPRTRAGECSFVRRSSRGGATLPPNDALDRGRSGACFRGIPEAPLRSSSRLHGATSVRAGLPVVVTIVCSRRERQPAATASAWCGSRPYGSLEQAALEDSLRLHLGLGEAGVVKRDLQSVVMTAQRRDHIQVVREAGVAIVGGEAVVGPQVLYDEERLAAVTELESAAPLCTAKGFKYSTGPVIGFELLPVRLSFP